jgi:hypothetical protein
MTILEGFGDEERGLRIFYFIDCVYWASSSFTLLLFDCLSYTTDFNYPFDVVALAVDDYPFLARLSKCSDIPWENLFFS